MIVLSLPRIQVIFLQLDIDNIKSSVKYGGEGGKR